MNNSIDNNINSNTSSYSAIAIQKSSVNSIASDIPPSNNQESTTTKSNSGGEQIKTKKPLNRLDSFEELPDAIDTDCSATTSTSSSLHLKDYNNKNQKETSSNISLNNNNNNVSNFNTKSSFGITTNTDTPPETTHNSCNSLDSFGLSRGEDFKYSQISSYR